MATLRFSVRIVPLVVSGIALFASEPVAQARDLSFDERFEAQRAIEQVYWNHRIWPKENPGNKPQLSEVMPEAAIRARVEDYLRMSTQLASTWKQPLTVHALQVELNRMTRESRDPQTLQELFAALGNDPFLIAETLARQSLADRLTRERFAHDEASSSASSFEAWWAARRAADPPNGATLPIGATGAKVAIITAPFTLDAVDTNPCVSDAWVATSTGANVPTARYSDSAVWTGAEMIVWGGFPTAVNTGGRYNPATNSWTPTSTGANVPSARGNHTAVWTGTEMIVWGGYSGFTYFDTGGRYNPATNSWVTTPTTGAPSARENHNAVWTGAEMIVWGGDPGFLNSGGRYSPSEDIWSPTSLTNAPVGRYGHVGVWTGTTMIVWGGTTGSFQGNGGVYAPSSNTWTATGGFNPSRSRSGLSGAWIGTEMIIWGGTDVLLNTPLNTGSRYNPLTFTWTDTSTGANVPSARAGHSAVWTGAEMIVWGGADTNGTALFSGGRYDPSSNTWTATGTGANVPSARRYHTAVWTGAEVIVWGGLNSGGSLNTGARYCVDLCASLVCVDGNPCTNDSCNPSTGCVYTNNTNACDDGNACTTGDACGGGSCQPGAGALNCDDSNPCTDDACSPASGCAHANNTSACSDGNACTTGDVCAGGVCQTGGGELNCDDSNVCTDDTCAPASGCAHANNSNACNDGNTCTTGDTCGGGSCQPGAGALNCDDNNPCTDDSCNPGSGCLHTNNTAPCDDGSLCTTGDTCGGGTCNATPVACNDGNVCTIDTCSPATGLCVYTGGDCVIDVDPLDDTIDVSVSTNVTLTYLDPIDPATVTTSTFRLIGPGEVAVPATLQVSTSGTRPTLDPAAALEPDTIYRVETTSGILGPGAVPTQPFTSYFRTGAATASTEIPTVSEPTSTLPTLAQGGASVSRAGDLNGDGIQDVLSGAPGFAASGALALGTVAEAGAVLVYFGSAIAAERAVPDIIFEGVDAHDRVGVSVAGDFDFNGDGRRDIVIGAEQVDRATDPENPTPTGNGKVYLIFFDLNDTVHYPNIANPSIPDTVSLALVGQPGGVPGIAFEGAAFGDQAGFSVAGGGTSTVSSGTDIVIGAPGADPGSQTDAGTVYVVFDNASLSGNVSLALVSNGLPDQVPGKAYLGEDAGDLLGFSTAFAGAVIQGQDPTTGSVLMGAPGSSGARGRLIAPPEDPDTTPIIVDAIGSTQSGFQILGTQPGEQLGWSVADGGDALADGAPDLLIGGPTYDVGGATDAGRVLETTQVIASGVYSADAVGTTISGTIWTGEAAGDQLGSAVDGTSDVTGDQFDDVVLGAPYVDPLVGGVPQTDAGAVYVVNGAPTADNLGTHSVTEIGDTIAGEELSGTEPGEHAGSSIAGSGDVSGDGENDFAVGAPAQNNDAGTVYLVLLAAPPPVGTCGPSGCQVADLATGAEIDVPPGALASTVILGVTGVVDAGALPAPVPDGKMLLGAAEFTPDGQTISSPFATIYIPTAQPFAALLAPSEVLPLFYFNGSAWVPAGVDGTTGPNPTYPTRLAISAVVNVLHVYAAFLNDADGDNIRDELDNCPTIANPTQLDTNGDDIGDACQCVNVNCSDGNVCTDDNCDPTFGCFNPNNFASCEDGVPCTSGDFCSDGNCNTGTPITAPPEAQDVSAASDKVTFSWSTTLYATSYDVVRGLTSALPVGPGVGDEVCFNNLAGTALVDSSVPGSGTAYWYLARGDNACGVGSYGPRSNGSPRVTTTCP